MTDNNIILKCDDFWGKDLEQEKSIFELARKYNIKISLGIVGFGLETTSQATIDYLKQNLDLIVPFNHSYWHVVTASVKEYFKTNKSYQIDSIKFTNNVIWRRLGVKVDTIGFPANACDNNAIDVLNKHFPELKNIYYTKIAHNRVEMDNLHRNIINVDFENVLQIHPFNNDFNVNALESLILGKLENGFNFITPADL